LVIEILNSFISVYTFKTDHFSLTVSIDQFVNIKKMYYFNFVNN